MDKIQAVCNRGYVTPNDIGIMGATDSESIMRAVRYAAECDIGVVRIPAYNERTERRLWEVDTAILLPNNITVILDGCYIRQRDGSRDNVFRNENMYGTGFATLEGEQHNISIIGIGNAIIDGGEPNGINEKNCNTEGKADIYVNNPILLHNVRDFTIRGITIRNPRWWSVNLIYCNDGIVDSLKIEAKDNIPNQDGVDIRLGCHNIVVSNILGTGGDDLIALTGILGGEKRRGFVVEGKSCHIRNIVVKNIVGTSVTKAIVAIRNQDGVRIEDVTVDTVHDTTERSCSPRSYVAVRIGHKAYFNERHSLPGETTRLNIRNIHARCQCAIIIHESLTDSYISGVYLDDTVDVAVTTSVGREFASITEEQRASYAAHVGAYIRNTVIENVFCSNKDRNPRAAIELCRCDENDGIENLVLNNIFQGGRARVLDSDFDTGIILGNILK